MQLPLSAILMIRDLSLLMQGAPCPVGFRGLTCVQSSDIAVMYSSSLGLQTSYRGDPGRPRIDRVIGGGGVAVVPNEMCDSKASYKEFKYSRTLDMSGASGVGA